MSDETGRPEHHLKTILVATDFSDTANAGLDWAMEIAWSHDATIHLLHILTLPEPAYSYLPSPVDVREALQSAAVGRLEEAAERAGERGVRVETDLRTGLPSETLIQVTEELRPDLLVMGTSGISGVRHLLLGSTTERVVQRAACPVLAIHPGDAGRHRPIRTLLVPTDFSQDAELAVASAHRLLRHPESETRLVLLHVYHLPVEYTAYGPIPTSIRYMEDVASEAQDRLDELAAKLRQQGLTVETVLREGYPPDLIVEEAQQRKADLIAMGTHGRSGLAHLLLGSTAERVVQHAPCPVMTVRHIEEEGEG